MQRGAAPEALDKKGHRMLDLISIVALAILFPVCLLYVHGCFHLKGKR